VTTVEDHAQRLIAAEVDTFFHGTKATTEQKERISKRAEKAVKKATDKVKKSVNDHTETKVYPFEDHPYPYAYPQINNKNKPVQHRDHRILHSVEAAEKAVLHAIEAEVDTLFHHEHESDHKSTVQAGLSKTAERVKDHHEDRRGWLLKQHDTGKGIDQYPNMFLESEWEHFSYIFAALSQTTTYSAANK